MDHVSVATGLLMLVAALACNGSFSVFVKVKRVVACEMQATTFVLFLALGVALSSWAAVLPLYNSLDPKSGDEFSFGFTWFGVLGGCLLVVSVTFSVLGIEYLGLAMATGTWGGAAIVVSFLWGAIVFHNHLTSLFEAIAALVLLLVGVAGIALNEAIASKLRALTAPRPDVGETEWQRLNPTAPSAQARGRSLSVERQEEMEQPERDLPRGLLCAGMVGVFGGSILAPAHYSSQHGLGFVPSFGIGCAVMGPIVVVVNSLLTGKWPNFKSRADLFIGASAGMASGVVWNMGNVANLFAIEGLQYAVANTLVQCSLFVGGLWGVFVFGEIRGMALVVFFVSSGILIAGAALLAAQA